MKGFWSLDRTHERRRGGAVMNSAYACYACCDYDFGYFFGYYFYAPASADGPRQGGLT